MEENCKCYCYYIQICHGITYKVKYLSNHSLINSRVQYGRADWCHLQPLLVVLNQAGRCLYVYEINTLAAGMVLA